MKNKIIVLAVMLATIIFSSSCSKEDELVKTEPKIQEIRQEVDKKYRSFACKTESNKNGTKCSISSWETSTCTKATDCTSSSEDALEASFTAIELENWAEGFELEYTEIFILEHYDYFMYLYENDLSYHPDTVLVLIKND